ncbi:glycosyltransferase family 4 protein [Niabella beijingensis]|uniref:glycosyltransferase family 4 protein n=1 Tax=Niabella beijingensis TaxID=2872700 RepID=UPI001CBFC283|nr:glycosyltransferase family 4 protein [Niabella beijingensis]MBZ4191774.1 glycosyltransferase family 4 protein [Niabella beijingensis]
MQLHLHIVCLDVPWPADYGGVIDMLNRIRAFNRMGVKVHLHYFSYNERGVPKELNAFCESVHVYERRKKTECLNLSLPYIVSSRVNQELAEQLSKDNYPVLLEGLHCTGIIPFIGGNRMICVRMHNNEEVYYKELARATSDLFKKLYYTTESRLIKKYVPTLPKNLLLACVSEADVDFFKELGFDNTFLLPTYPSWQEVNSLEGMGTHCLFHGNLSVAENEEAALWLLHKVFNKVRVPFIIAGKDPGRQLQKAASLCQHTCLISNPSESEINDLVQKAHINVLPNFNKNITGIRLKLLHSLYSGRHCVTTPAMVTGTGLEPACHIGSNSNAIASIISQLYYKPFEDEEIKLRKQLVEQTFNNDKNTTQLMQRLW